MQREHILIGVRWNLSTVLMYERKRSVFVFLTPAYVSQHNYFLNHLSSWKYHNFTFLYSWIESYCIYAPQSFLIQAFADRLLGWFHILLSVNRAAINMEASYLCGWLLWSFRCSPGAVRLGHTLLLSFLRKLHTDFHSGYASLDFCHQWISEYRSR